MSKFDFLDRFNKPRSFDVDIAAIDTFAAEIGGEIVASNLGRFLLSTTGYPSGFVHGTQPLRTIFERGHIELSNFDHAVTPYQQPLSDLVLVDAETTGLSAATGTVAFLIGLGIIRDEKLEVYQFFLPDYADEPAMLDAIAEIVEDRKIVVSFNGKCFDLPLLETRFAMHKMQTPFREMFHIDLLHSCRRYWKGRFEDTTLQTLERELLGVFRHNDTPGHLIPQLYFDYLRHGRSEPLAGVLLHNRLDIVTLLFLADVVHGYLDRAEQSDFYSPLDALRISRFYQRQGNTERACVAADRQLVSFDGGEESLALCLHTFRLHKRLGRYDVALSILDLLASARGETRLLALNESAKLLEHNKREYGQAAAIVLEALGYLDSPIAEIPFDRVSFWNETLQKRHLRLLRRIK